MARRSNWDISEMRGRDKRGRWKKIAIEE